MLGQIKAAVAEIDAALSGPSPDADLDWREWHERGLEFAKKALPSVNRDERLGFINQAIQCFAVTKEMLP